MASSKDYLNFILEQLAELDELPMPKPKNKKQPSNVTMDKL